MNNKCDLNYVRKYYICMGIIFLKQYTLAYVKPPYLVAFQGMSVFCNKPDIPPEVGPLKAASENQQHEVGV